MNILKFLELKKQNKKISMVTCYDFTMARILAQTDIDVLLVGDSAAMVMHGFTDTIPATINLMELHVAAVKRGAANKFIIGDMPFLSFRSDLHQNVHNVGRIMQAGAQAIKLEGAAGNLQLIEHLVHSGIPVMGHLGLTPQFINQFGGFKVQGRDQSAAQRILADAKALEAAGCFALVLECVPAPLAAQITSSLEIPTIGIGAGVDCDGQVLVLQDLLGMNTEFKPRFLRQYMNGFEMIRTAVNQFHHDVRAKSFPQVNESYE